MTILRRHKLVSYIKNGLSCVKGQTLIEYALLLILIAVVLVAIITIVGARTNNMYSRVNNAVPNVGSTP